MALWSLRGKSDMTPAAVAIGVHHSNSISNTNMNNVTQQPSYVKTFIGTHCKNSNMLSVHLLAISYRLFQIVFSEWIAIPKEKKQKQKQREEKEGGEEGKGRKGEKKGKKERGPTL